MPFWKLLFEAFQPFDYEILKFIHSHTSGWLDSLMIFWSDKRVWFPFYALLVGYWYLKEGKSKTIWAVFTLVLAILMADQIASSVLKPLTERLRPCHDSQINFWLHLPAGCGGKFGFVSSHAGNSLAFSLCVFWLFPNQKFLIPILWIWIFMTAYSRMYLGAHFPSDILGGWLVGTFSAGISVFTNRKMKSRF
jgi:undecaprenyl-diphosphatase